MEQNERDQIRDIAELQTKVDRLEGDVKECVTKADIWVIRVLVFGQAGIWLTAIALAICALVVKRAF